MKTVFIGELIPEIPHTEILFPNLGNKEQANPFGEKVFGDFTVPVVEIVQSAKDANYLCIPHNYNYIKNNEEYLRYWNELAAETHKKVLVFFPGDSDEPVKVKNAIVFRNSQYRSRLKQNEIIMPAYAHDLGKKYEIEYQEKREKPVVGFCGWADFKTSRERFAYFIKTLVRHGVEKPGLYFRRRALSILEKSGGVDTNFIIRTSYSLNSKTLGVDPVVAREEYIDVIKKSDFVLAPKGDGNFSVRFFEVLSLARLPLLIDTDSPLPLEKDIDYSRFVVKVDHKEVEKAPEIAKKFFASLPPDQYIKRQQEAREAFEKYLKIDVFFTYIFTGNNLEKYVGSSN